MSWARIDDKSTWHRKVIKAGNRAWGALVRMITHCKDLGTDGRVAVEVAKAIQEEDEIERLLAVGLLDADGSDYLVHDFLEWNESAKQAEKTRKARSRAGRASAQQRANKHPNTCSNTTPTNGVGVGDLSLRETTDQNATQPKRRARTTSTTIPADWEPGDGFWAWCRREGYDERAVRAEVPRFVHWWTGTGGKRADWDATLKNRVADLCDQGRIAKREAPPAPPAAEQIPTPIEDLAVRAQATDLIGALTAAKTAPARARPPDAEPEPASGLRTRPGVLDGSELVPAAGGAP